MERGRKTRASGGLLQCGDIRPFWGHPPGWRHQGLWDLLQMSTPVAVDSLANPPVPGHQNPLGGLQVLWRNGDMKGKHWFPDQGDLGFL